MNYDKGMTKTLARDNVNVNKRTNSFKHKMMAFWPFYVMFIPVAAYYLIFSYAPMAGIIIAFKDYNFTAGMFGSEWAGWTHFERFLTNGDFWRVFNNTIVISSLRIFVGFPAPIILALLLNEVKSKKYKRFVQTITYLPHFISWVVISGILFSFFSSYGIVNQIIREVFQKDPVGFLSDEKYFRTFLVATSIWKEVGWSAIIYLATLSGVDEQLYEASVIDGANRWQQLIYITIPSISPVISTMFILSFANVLSVGFEQVMALINTAVISVGETIDYYIYRVGITQISNHSYAAAVGLFKSLLSLVLVVFTNWGAKKIDEDGGLW